MLKNQMKYKIKTTRTATRQQKKFVEGQRFNSRSSANRFLRGAQKFGKKLRGRVVLA